MPRSIHWFPAASGSSRVPDKHIIDRMADRRPEFYSLLVAPHELKTPRQDHHG